MRKLDFVMTNVNDSREIGKHEIMKAELVEVLKVWTIDYLEAADGRPLMTFERQSDNKLVAYWVIEDVDLSSITENLDFKKRVKESTGFWIAIWHLQRRVGEECVLGQIMSVVKDLAPLPIEYLQSS